MKPCGHEHVTVKDCETCYIVVLKKRVARLLVEGQKRLDRIAELEEEKARTWGAIDAGSERYKARIKELEAENRRLRELFDRWGSSGDVVAASYAMQAKLVMGGGENG